MTSCTCVWGWAFPGGAGCDVNAGADCVGVAAGAIDCHAPFQGQCEPVAGAAAVEPDEHGAGRRASGGCSGGGVEGAGEDWAAAVGGDEVGVSVAVEVAVGEALARSRGGLCLCGVS